MDKLHKDFTSTKDTYYAALTFSVKLCAAYQQEDFVDLLVPPYQVSNFSVSRCS